MKSSQSYKRLVTDYLKPHFESLGFHEKKREFYCQWHGDVLWRISPSYTPDRDRDGGGLTIVFAIGFKRIAEFLLPFEGANIDSQKVRYPTAMATDLGHLGPQHNFFEWRISPETDLATLSLDIIQSIEQHGLPFFDRWGTLEKMMSAWRERVFYGSGFQADMSLAAALWLDGKQVEASDHIKNRIRAIRASVDEKGKNVDRLTLRELECFLEWLQNRNVRV